MTEMVRLLAAVEDEIKNTIWHPLRGRWKLTRRLRLHRARLEALDESMISVRSERRKVTEREVAAAAQQSLPEAGEMHN